MSIYPPRALAFLICFTALCAKAQSPSFSSVIVAGGSRQNSGNAIAVDSAGSSYVAGSFGDQFGGSIDLGGIHLVSAGRTDGFLAKFDTQGNCLWARQFSGGLNNDAYVVSVRSDGPVFVAGEFSGTNAIGSTNLVSHGGSDIFVAAFTSSGSLLWAKSMGGGGDDFAIGLTIDQSGLFFTGSFDGNVDLGSGITLSSADEDAVLMKLNSAGSVQWARAAGGEGIQFGSDVKVDASGNVFWAGEFEDAISFASTNLSSTSHNVFLAKYDNGGDLLSARTLGTGDEARLPRLALTPEGGLLCSAAYSGDYAIGAQSLPLAADDVLLACFSAAGDLQWVNTFGGPELDACTGLVLDPAGDCYLAGYFHGAMSVGGQNLTSVGDSDVFVARCTKDGRFEGAIRAGGPGPDLTLLTAAAPNGEIRLTGSFYGTAQFGDISVTSPDLVPKMFLAVAAPAPRLKIVAFPTYVLVSWPASVAGFTLEDKSELSDTSWSPIGTAPTVINGEFVVTNQFSGPKQFFRLRN